MVFLCIDSVQKKTIGNFCHQGNFLKLQNLEPQSYYSVLKQEKTNERFHFRVQTIFFLNGQKKKKSLIKKVSFFWQTALFSRTRKK